MPELHISKVAVGCASLDALAARQRLRLAGGVVSVATRFRPKRADELVGGSLFWIVRHRLSARQTIVGFGECEDGLRTIIRLDPKLVAVRTYPKRAHQGWRYLAAADAPPDLSGAGIEGDDLPPALVSELAALALI